MCMDIYTYVYLSYINGIILYKLFYYGKTSQSGSWQGRDNPFSYERYNSSSSLKNWEVLNDTIRKKLLLVL